MPYTLYYSPGACSMAVHVVLNELGADFTAKPVQTSQGEQRKPEFLAINPRGQIPVLIDGTATIREGAAIITYLCDKHASALIPQNGPGRAAALEWLMFANATLHPAYGMGFTAMKAPDLSDDTRAAMFKLVEARINALWQDVENHLTKANTPYLCGNDCTPGDILLAVIANWTALPIAITIGPKTRELFKRVVARPSYQKALASEQVTYKAAA